MVVMVVALTALAAPVTGTDTTSRISGLVFDVHDRPVAGATLTLNSAILIGGERSTVSNQNGEFSFMLLPPGNYDLLVSKATYKPVQQRIRVELGRATRLRFELSELEFSGALEVSAAQPLVDTAMVGSGQSFNAEYLRHAAIGVAGRDYLAMAATAAGAVGSTDLHIMGSTISDNAFYVDGFNSTDPMSATAGVRINFDAIQELSVQTGGFEAEFGQAIGGIINMVTKSGGNNFSGALDLRYQDRGFIDNGDHFDPDKEDSSVIVASATLGGPITRDRIWFFASYRFLQQERTEHQAPLTEKTTGIDWIAKTTWQVNESNRLVLKASGDPCRIDNSEADIFTAADAGAHRDLGSSLLHAELNSQISDSLLLSAVAGRSRSHDNLVPMSRDFEMPSIINDDTGITSQNSSLVSISDRETLQQVAKLSWFVDDVVGSHEFKTGLDFRRLKSLETNFITGDAILETASYDPDGSRGGSGRHDEDGDGLSDNGARVWSPRQREPKRYVSDVWAAFIQDNWRVVPSVTIKPGVRFDRVSFDSEGRGKVADFSLLQPRFGVAWDIAGDGKQVLRASWGRYMHPAALSLASLMSALSPFPETSYIGADLVCSYFGVCDPELAEQTRGEPWIWVDQEGDVHRYYHWADFEMLPFESIETLGLGTLDAPTMSQLFVGFERQVARQVSFELQYVRKATRDLLETTCDNQSWIWGDGNTPDINKPSTYPDPYECDFFVVANVPDSKRDYEAAITKLEARGRSLSVVFSYTWSRSRGSSDTLAEEGYNAYEFSFYPRDFYQIYGYLDDDARHRLKLNGYALLPHDFTIGFNAFWSSAPAINRVADCGALHGLGEAELDALNLDPGVWQYCGGWFYGPLQLEPRGSHRGKSISQIDLQLSKAFQIGQVSLSGIVTVLNVLSSERPETYNDSELVALPWGAPTAYQNPRSFELGVRLEF